MSRSRSSDSPAISITRQGPHDVLWNRIPDDQALRVGRFIAAWGLIEFKLECLIWDLIGSDQRYLRRLTARLEWRPKAETIDELLVVRKPPADQAEAWASAKQLIGQLVAHRNVLAHGVWVPCPIGSVGLMQTRRGGIRKNDQNEPEDIVVARIAVVTSEEVDGWIADSPEAIAHLNKLLEWTASPAPSPDTP